MKDGKEINVLKAEDSFGEAALLQGDQFRAMTIVAKEETTCLALGRNDLNKILGNQVETIIYKNMARWCFEKCSHVNELT